jgi:hypothetical protein
MPRQQTKQNQNVPRTFQYTGPIVPQAYNQNQAPAAPTFGQVVKDGFGFGVGTAVARQVVDRLFGPSVATAAPQQKKDDPIMSPFLTDQQRLQYNQCILEGGTHSHCKELLQ